MTTKEVRNIHAPRQGYTGRRIPVEEARRLYEQEMWNTKDIARHLGFTEQHIRERMKEAGVVFRYREFPLEEAIKLYAEGLTTAQVGERISYSSGQVQRKLRGAGVLRPKGPLPTQSPANIDTEKARALYEQGYNLEEIGRVFGYHQETVRQHFKRHAIKVRNHSEAALHRKKLLREMLAAEKKALGGVAERQGGRLLSDEASGDRGFAGSSPAPSAKIEAAAKALATFWNNNWETMAEGPRQMYRDAARVALESEQPS